MKANLTNLSTKIFALIVLLCIISLPAAYAYTEYSTISVSSDYGAVTWFKFDETGYITDSANSCFTNHGGVKTTIHSQCFTAQFNSDNSTLQTIGNFYQAIMYVNGSQVYWNDFIGCNYQSMSCNYFGSGYTYSPVFSGTYLNSTNNVFVLAINAGDTSITGWSITSCNYGFTTAAYTFKFFVLNLSTCTASEPYSENPGATYMTDNKFGQIQSVDVGVGNGSNSTFKHTQVTGELFNYNLGTYSGHSNSLTAEGSNMVFHDGTIGSVVPMCYHSPDATAPC